MRVRHTNLRAVHASPVAQRDGFTQRLDTIVERYYAVLAQGYSFTPWEIAFVANYCFVTELAPTTACRVGLHAEITALYRADPDDSIRLLAHHVQRSSPPTLMRLIDEVEDHRARNGCSMR